ncbi:hypothetical protein [Thioclava pacifica]|uniref:Sulfotransferase domain-containing protein n=1 Tax=Thioclava pacifica DSM 10166 TaxID=1353537 RepID=A0A074JAG2_9RHOB|nr:hypothetical protein [Thioclava pacifica]KEO53534.1 hypothetical protein TP2_17620 [Thioclava pacifica DSM 10166]
MRVLGERAAILHIGAPKCGSSALQTVLSGRPDLIGAQGQSLRYSALQAVRGRGVRLRGAMLRHLATWSPYGYLSWPDLGRQVSGSTLFHAIGLEIAQGRRDGYVPILSSEGWIRHPERFAKALAAMGFPPVEVIAYLRPPLPWLNAAFWQWGVWTRPSFDDWLRQRHLPYSFGMNLRRWSEIPNLTLHVASGNVLNDFAARVGSDLGQAVPRHGALPPALMGFLLRNRRFRRDGHDAALEFIVQRWCPPSERRAWAIAPHHLSRIATLTQENRQTLEMCLPTEMVREVLADPLWQEECPYLPEIEAGPSRLDDREALAELVADLDVGCARASHATGLEPQGVPERPRRTAPLSDWDAVVADLLVRLIALDRRARRRWAWGRLLQLDDRIARARDMAA